MMGDDGLHMRPGAYHPSIFGMLNTTFIGQIAIDKNGMI